MNPLARSSLILVPLLVVAVIAVIVNSLDGGHGGSGVVNSAASTATTLAPTAECTQVVASWVLQLDETGGGALADADRDYGSQNPIVYVIFRDWGTMKNFELSYGRSTALQMALPSIAQSCEAMVAADEWPPDSGASPPTTTPASTTLPSTGLPPGYNPDSGYVDTRPPG